jgi:hypothetical protein
MSVENTPMPSVGHRTDKRRSLIQRFQEWTPTIIGNLYQNGVLDGTQIARALDTSGFFLPNDVTLTQLELTRRSAEEIVSSGLRLRSGVHYWGASAFDLFDGNLAREMEIASAEGAMNDISVDRIIDIWLVRLVANMRNNYEYCPENLAQDLEKAVQLSSLTKAACEMCGVKTTEGGLGSMTERRRVLFGILADIGALNTQSGLVTRQKLLERIDKQNLFLINGSLTRAIERTNTILNFNSFKKFDWYNPALRDPNSSASVEARKYTAILHMDSLLGIPMHDQLNALNYALYFPSSDYLIGQYPYIDKSIKNTSGFLHQALSIAELAH